VETINIFPPYGVTYPGGTQKVYCEGKNVVWSKDGIKIPDYKIALGEVLILENINYSDSGIYMCSERNILLGLSPKKYYELFVGG